MNSYHRYPSECFNSHIHCFSATILAVAAVLLMILPTETAIGQNNRRGGKQRPPSANKKEKPQDGAKTGDRQSLTATAIVHVKGGEKHQAATVKKLRNGDIQVTLLDGSTITIAKRDLVDVKKIGNSQQQKKNFSDNSTSRNSSTKADRAPSQKKVNSGDRSDARNSQTGKKPMPRRDALKAQPKASSETITIQMTDGQQISGIAIKLLDRKSLQLTSETNQRMAIDRAMIGKVTRVVDGQKVKMGIGRNGEIQWLPDTGDAADASQSNPGDVGSATMYDTLSESGSSISKNAVRETLLASCNDLRSISIKLEGDYEVEVRVLDRETEAILGTRTVTVANAGLTNVFFSPPLSLTPGNRYRIEIERTGNDGKLTAYVTANDEYVFSRLQFHNGSTWNSQSGNNKQNDLVMRVKGNSPVTAPTNIPSQKALLVLLENDGIVGSLGAAGIDYPEIPDVVYMVYTGNEREIEFKLNKNESVSQALTRVGSDLEEIAEDEVGSPPQPPKVETLLGETENPLDPEYVQEMGQYTADLAALTAKLMNPNNWETRIESADEFVSTISDLVIEHFTSDYILGKTQNKYDQVVVIEDTQFEAPNVLAAIEQLGSNYILDVHVLSHGRVDHIVGHDTGGQHELDRGNFFIPLQQARLRGDTALHLRTVYQCICTGGSLKREWHALGAKAVNGTRGEVSGEAKKNYMPQQYIHFLDYWCDQNKSFKQASEMSFADASNYSISVYSALSDKPDLIQDSELTVSGDGGIKRSP